MANPTPFQRKLATLAQREYEKFHLLRENQEPLAAQIRGYWSHIGIPFQSVSVPWSAVFVSWCVKQAGATKSQFTFAAAHAKFMFDAIKNAKQGTGVFLGREVASYSPKMGDILQNNRSGNKFDFKYASTHSSYISHSAIVIEVGVDNVGNYLRTIGGNESDSVGMKEVRLDSKGRVKDTSGVFKPPALLLKLALVKAGYEGMRVQACQIILRACRRREHLDALRTPFPSDLRPQESSSSSRRIRPPRWTRSRMTSTSVTTIWSTPPLPWSHPTRGPSSITVTARPSSWSAPRG